MGNPMETALVLVGYRWCTHGIDEEKPRPYKQLSRTVFSFSIVLLIVN